MKRFALFALDVWGREEDGYEVNDLYQQAFYMEAEELPSFVTVQKILKKAGFLKKRFRYNEPYSFEDVMQINYKNYPLFFVKETEDTGEGSFFYPPRPAQVYRVHPKRTVRIR